MSRARQFIMAGSTFSVALGIGFVMQNGDALANRFADDTAATVVISQPIPEVEALVAADTMTLPVENPLAERVAAQMPVAEPVRIAPPVELAVVMPEDIAPPSFAAPDFELVAFGGTDTLTDVLPGDPTALQPVCGATLTAVVGAAAMVNLNLTAPCAPNAAVVIHHQGMMFTVVTDDAGKTMVTVPALAEASVFLADLADGTGAAASVMVPDLADFDRAVLQWQGMGGMQLHALEFGATYAADGHVWSGATRDAAIAATGQGGFMTRLGDDKAENALIAEIYTFPSGTTLRDGTIDLTVEAEVTAANCGQAVSAQSIQIIPDAEPQVIDLTLTMPDCAAVGEFLVMDNMLQDLVLASK